jgi:hypothetical protein
MTVLCVEGNPPAVYVKILGCSGRSQPESFCCREAMHNEPDNDAIFHNSFNIHWNVYCRRNVVRKALRIR